MFAKCVSHGENVENGERELRCISTVLSLPGDSDGELLAQFCGQNTPGIPLVVFTPELWVHFQTDQTEGDVGFKATYMFSGEP